MLTQSPLVMAVIGLLLALWLGGGALAVWSGLRMRRAARHAQAQVDRIADLLQSAPAIPVLVRDDGRIEAPERLAIWLGLDATPAFLSELAHPQQGGLSPEHAVQLGQLVEAAQRGGKSFALPVRARGSDRTLLVRGMPAGPDLAGPGTSVLWIFDATESQSQIESLRTQVAGYRDALEALSGLIEAAPMPVWHRTPDLRLSLVNSHYVRAVDATSAAEVVEQGTELVEPVDGLSPAQAAARAAQAGHMLTRDVPVTIDGRRRMMRIVDVPLGPSGIAGYAIDIQDLDEVRDELRQVGQTNRDMLDRLSAGVAQFGPDRRLQFCNQPFISIFRLQADLASAGIDFDRVIDAMRDAGTVPETPDYRGWRQARSHWFLSPGASEETWLLREGMHLRVFAQPLPNGGLLLIFEDRTEQIQLSSARDTLLRVRTATLDNLFEAIAVFAADGRLHLWNSRFRQSWSVAEPVLAAHPRVDELMGQMSDRLARPEQASLVHQLIRAATVERRQRGGRIAFADGRYFEFAAMPLPDGNALFVMLDISDSRRIEQALRDRNEALEEADRIKTAFVSNMSYELRTPLTSIAGFAEMLHSGYAGPLETQAQDYVEAIISSTDRLASLIDSVLDLTQGAAGRMPIAREPVDLARLIDEAIARHEAEASAREVTLVRNIEPGLGQITGDARRIGQAIDHLVDNAVRYVGRNGRVLIHGDGTAAQARIVVSDNGPGIDPALQPQLFDSFARFAQNGHGEQRGMGLPLVRQFSEAHGGSVELLSELGQGTAVTITLPRG
jgi:signal transduction histidine kinase